jgi:hypothetical protein
MPPLPTWHKARCALIGGEVKPEVNLSMAFLRPTDCLTDACHSMLPYLARVSSLEYVLSGKYVDCSHGFRGPPKPSRTLLSQGSVLAICQKIQKARRRYTLKFAATGQRRCRSLRESKERVITWKMAQDRKSGMRRSRMESSLIPGCGRRPSTRGKQSGRWVSLVMMLKNMRGEF